MNSKLSKILAILIAVIAVIGLVLFINVSMAGEDPGPLDAAVGPLVAFSTFLLYATIAIALILSLLGLFKNPEQLKKALLSLGIMAVILIVAYMLGDSEPVLDAQGAVIEGGEAGAASNQWIGTLIWYSTMLIIIGGIFFVFDLVKGLLKS